MSSFVLSLCCLRRATADLGSLSVSALRLLGPISLQHRNELIRHLSGWDYRPYSLSQEDLFRCNCLMFEATLAIEGIWELEIDCSQSHPSSACMICSL